jgi:hypothetical protein
MKFQLSINKNMINKANPATYGWINAEFAGENLYDHVSEGFAFSPGVLKPQASGRKPSIKDVQFASILAIDIDNDVKEYNGYTKKYDKRIKTIEEGYLTFQEAFEDEFVQENALLLYTTPSHQPEFQRFRIVFVNDKEISSPSEYRHSISKLIERFGGDKSCSNIDRLFYGNRDCDMEYLGKTLNYEILKPEQELL